MTGGYIIFLFIVGVILIFLNWRRKRKQIDEAWLESAVVLGRWKYTPEQWKKLSEDYFPWIKNKDLPGEFSISDDSILISNGKDEFFRDLKGEWTLTDISYRDGSPIFHIKLRKMRLNQSLGYYDYEEIWIPLPPGNAEKTTRVVEHFHQNTKESTENLKGAGTNDLLFGQFLNSESDDEKTENL